MPDDPRTAGRGQTPARLGLLVLQPTPFCNIDCAYCYLPQRRSTARMTLDTLDAVCRRVFSSPLLGDTLDIAWHGGEPLVAPLDWYEEAFALVAAQRPSGLRLTHCFQTNGVLLDDRWARVLAAQGARVGISIDGPAQLHDRNRRTRAGHGTHAAAMRAVRRLQDHGTAFHVITVLTDPALDDPDGLFEFYLRHGIADVGLNVDEIEAANAASSLSGPAAEMRFRRFMARFFALVRGSPGRLRVREFEVALAAVLSPEPVQDPQNMPMAIVSVGHDGSVSSFSPELLGARHPRFGGFAFGHVAADSLAATGRTPAFQAIDREIQAGVSACERSCRYFRWCGGGAPANKLFETGRFDTAETMHCRLSRQVVIDQVLQGLRVH